jgi:peptidoglycan-associated lipoprotein
VSHTKSAALFTTLGLLLAACSSTPVAPSSTASTSDATSTAAASSAAPTAASARPMTTASDALPAYLDPNSGLSTQRSVYFGFDDYSLDSKYLALIEQHGRFLASNPTVAIKIEGNSDERGGSEYNLALGQRRAESVLRALKVYGVKVSQMEATSWGETKPKALDHDEAAWAQNRRADLQYPSR